MNKRAISTINNTNPGSHVFNTSKRFKVVMTNNFTLSQQQQLSQLSQQSIAASSQSLGSINIGASNAPVFTSKTFINTQNRSAASSNYGLSAKIYINNNSRSHNNNNSGANSRNNNNNNQSSNVANKKPRDLNLVVEALTKTSPSKAHSTPPPHSDDQNNNTTFYAQHQQYTDDYNNKNADGSSNNAYYQYDNNQYGNYYGDGSGAVIDNDYNNNDGTYDQTANGDSSFCPPYQPQQKYYDAQNNNNEYNNGYTDAQYDDSAFYLDGENDYSGAAANNSTDDIANFGSDSQTSSYTNYTDNSFGEYNVEDLGPGEYDGTVDDGMGSGVVGYDHANARSLYDFEREIQEASDENSFYGLPDLCRVLYANRGVTKLYDWQEELLTTQGLLEGENVLYSLPTSGGKSLIAELVLLRHVIVHKKKALFILPYVSLVEEKKGAFETFSERFQFNIEAYHGNHGPLPVPVGNQLCIATIEKANTIINQMIEENRIEEFGCCVVDELHMVGQDGGARGSLLELVMTKIRYVCPNIQIVGMSATIPNLIDLCDWLGARIFEANFRPVELQQFVKVGDNIYDQERNLVRTLYNDNPKKDQDNLKALITEVAPTSSVLIFCSSKKGCEQCASHLCEILPKDIFMNTMVNEKQTLLQELKAANSGNNSGGIDEVLRKTIPMGIAYHHSGLTSEERELLEEAYRNRVICVLTCTSTLAAGVNLPARRVIFRQPYTGNVFLTKSRYLQMAGRAGRAGLDKFGDSFLILSKKEEEKGFALVKQELQPLVSSLDQEGIQRVVLELLCSRLAKSEQDIIRFAKMTFFYKTATKNKQAPDSKTNNNTMVLPDSNNNNNNSAPSATVTDVEDPICKQFLEAIDYLVSHKFINLVDANSAMAPTDSQLSSTSSVAMGAAGMDSQSSSYLDSQNNNDDDSQGSSSVLANNSSPPRLSALQAASPESAVSSEDNNKEDGDGDDDKIHIAGKVFEPTPFGLATFKSSFSLSEAAFVSRELMRAQEEGVVLVDELHLCYLITPIGVGNIDVNWKVLYEITNKLPKPRQRIAQSVGLCDGFLMNKAMNPMASKRSSSTNVGEVSEKEMVATRFFYAMILCDLINEKSFYQVEQRYKVNRGAIQNLLQSAAMFAGMMVRFCNRMEWWGLEAIIQTYAKRLGAGVKASLLELIEIPNCKAARARALYNAGYRDAQSVATADPDDMVKKLGRRLGPYPRAAAVRLIDSAKQHLLRKAQQAKNNMNAILDTILG